MRVVSFPALGLDFVPDILANFVSARPGLHAQTQPAVATADASQQLLQYGVESGFASGYAPDPRDVTGAIMQ
jgi:hypothetical protein